jgi:hypothetical protein
MKLILLPCFILCLALVASPAFAQDDTFSAPGKEAIAPVAPEAPIDLYEGGRGLITLEGPAGLFINPTSGTLPAGAATLQYCFFLPTNNFNLVGHGLLAAYGVTDWLEIGGIGNYIDNDADPAAGGPMVRIRLLKDEGMLPEFSVGYYGRYGTQSIRKSGMFAAAFKRFPIGDESGVLRSVGAHIGVREVWEGPNNDDTFRAWLGAEAQLPLRIYMVGEVSTDQNAAKTPYSYGLQWRMGGINISVAGIQNGGTKNNAFYFGVGSQLQF